MYVGIQACMDVRKYAHHMATYEGYHLVWCEVCFTTKVHNLEGLNHMQSDLFV